jgi:serine/threonine-protein kinase TNNI3K
VCIEAFLGEAKFLTRLEHPYIVMFLGVAWDSLSDLCVVTEFMEGGDLRSLLHRFDTELIREASCQGLEPRFLRGL